jgi:hypothetical protein
MLDHLIEPLNRLGPAVKVKQTLKSVDTIHKSLNGRYKQLTKLFS